MLMAFLEKPSLEVTPTTLQLGVTYLVSNSGLLTSMSTSQPALRHIRFLQFCFHFSPQRNILIEL